MSKVVMQLFVSGRSLRSDAAISNLELTLADAGISNFDLTIVDVIADPQAAEDNFILATPTLIKYEPKPESRIIGDLSDQASLLSGLHLLKQPS